MTAPTRLIRPAVESQLPLQLPLEFKHPDGSAGTRPLRPGEVLLAAGSYTATCLITYTEKTTCDGCGRPQQARTFAVLRDDDTGEQVHVGLHCLSTCYQQQAIQVRQHAAQVRRIQRTLLDRLRLRGVGIEEAIAQVSELARQYLPYSAHHLQALRAIDRVLPTKEDQTFLVRIKELALYHREWRDDPEFARQRWDALRVHPILSYLGARTQQRIREASQRALGRQSQLTEAEVHDLNVWLARASRWTLPFQPLVAAEQFDDARSYETALAAALDELLQSQRHSHEYWRLPFVRHPTEIVSLETRQGFGLIAQDPGQAETSQRTIQGETSYRTGTHSVLVRVGERRTYTEADQMRRRGGQDEEEDGSDDVLRRGRVRPYVPVAWTLIEHHTATHQAWNRWGRTRLEQYL